MEATNIDYEDEDIRRAHTNVEARKACFETCKRKNHASAALGHQWDEKHVPHWHVETIQQLLVAAAALLNVTTMINLV